MNRIYQFCDQKIMHDADLADRCQVKTKYLKRQIKRNIERFPEDFMFEPSLEEVEILRCQKSPQVQTGEEHITGQVNIQIIRVFTNMRAVMLQHLEVLARSTSWKEAWTTGTKKCWRFTNV